MTRLNYKPRPRSTAVRDEIRRSLSPQRALIARRHEPCCLCHEDVYGKTILWQPGTTKHLNCPGR